MRLAAGPSPWRGGSTCCWAARPPGDPGDRGGQGWPLARRHAGRRAPLRPAGGAARRRGACGCCHARGRRRHPRRAHAPPLSSTPPRAARRWRCGAARLAAGERRRRYCRCPLRALPGASGLPAGRAWRPPADAAVGARRDAFRRQAGSAPSRARQSVRARNRWPRPGLPGPHRLGGTDPRPAGVGPGGGGPPIACAPTPASGSPRRWRGHLPRRRRRRVRGLGRRPQGRHLPGPVPRRRGRGSVGWRASRAGRRRWPAAPADASALAHPIAEADRGAGQRRCPGRSTPSRLWMRALRAPGETGDGRTPPVERSGVGEWVCEVWEAGDSPTPSPPSPRWRAAGWRDSSVCWVGRCRRAHAPQRPRPGRGLYARGGRARPRR